MRSLSGEAGPRAKIPCSADCGVFAWPTTAPGGFACAYLQTSSSPDSLPTLSDSQDANPQFVIGFSPIP